MQNTTRTRKLGMAIAMWAMTATTLIGTSTGTLSARPIDEAEGVLFHEGFDDDRLPERGWYDGRTFAIDREGARGGDGCIAYHWKRGHDDAGRLVGPAPAVRADGYRLSCASSSGCRKAGAGPGALTIPT